MASVKLTKHELKAQKDLLKMYQRYLPTLTLKKQQLQMEIYAIRAQANAVRSARALPISLSCEAPYCPAIRVRARPWSRALTNG